MRSAVAAMAATLVASAIGFATAGEEKPAPTFTLTAIAVEGNTVLSQAELDALTAPYTGRPITMADAQKLRLAVAAAYSARGYVTTRVILPPQDLSAGRLVLRVAEGVVGSVTVQGWEYYTPEHNYLPFLPRTGEALNARTLEDRLHLINLHPGKEAHVVLEEGSEPGTTDLIVKTLETRPFHVALGLNNASTVETPELRSVVTVRHDNVFDRSQLAAFQFVTAPEEMQNIQQYAISYVIPLAPLGGPAGHEIATYFVYSDVETAEIFSLFRLRGKGTALGLQYTFPLPTCLSFHQSLSVGLEWQVVEDAVLFGPADFTEKVRTLPVVVRWAAIRQDADRAMAVWMGLRWQEGGLLLNPDEDSYNAVRLDLDTDFVSILLGTQVQQNLPGDFSLIATLQGFLSSDRLLPSEQFGLGGFDTVRGYRYRLVSADTAVLARIELRSPAIPCPLTGSTDRRLQLLGFLDGAWAHNHDAGAFELDNDSLLGAGVGARVDLFDSAVVGRVDLGWALRDVDATDDAEEGEFRVHFGVEITL